MMDTIEWEEWQEARETALANAKELTSIYRNSITEVFFNIYLRGYRDGVRAVGKSIPETVGGEEE